MSDTPWGMVTFDIDGTLTLGHGWQVVADRFGRRVPYDRTMALINRGEISEDANLENLLSVATGHTVAEVEEVLAQTPKPAHIAETVRALHDQGIRAALLSHNPAYVCDWYARTFGFDAYEGCETPPPVNGVIPPPGHPRADKVAFLQRLLARTGIPAAAVVHVGDSRPDAVIFGRVGGGIAFNAPLREVREQADAVVDSEDLADILLVLERLTPRTVPL